jgi:pimeloyl-ACP methyl ester carboxylesterase
MSAPFRSIVALVCLPFLVSAPARGQDASLVAIKTPRGVTQKFILIKPKQPPVASVILFAGGLGALGLKSATEMKWGRLNFLIRVRNKFAPHNIMVAVPDAPSDKRQGLYGSFRLTKTHAIDIDAIAAHLKQQADVPVWTVGTSLGGFSAASGAIYGHHVHGLVLTSTTTRSLPGWPIAKSHPHAVASMPLASFKGPALILSHAKDGCQVSPAADSEKLRKALKNAGPVEVALLEGGEVQHPNPCEAMGHHGFLGIEGRAVDTMAKFIIANSK